MVIYNQICVFHTFPNQPISISLFPPASSPRTDDSSPSDKIPEWSESEEYQEIKNWRSVIVGGEPHRIDMKVIEPYKKVLSHGGKSSIIKTDCYYILSYVLFSL